MNQITVMGICTLPASDRQFLVAGPAIIHIMNGKLPKKELKKILVPMVELEGTASDVRKRAHEMVDQALDDWETANTLPTPEGTIRVWSEKEEKHL